MYPQSLPQDGEKDKPSTSNIMWFTLITLNKTLQNYLTKVTFDFNSFVPFYLKCFKTFSSKKTKIIKKFVQIFDFTYVFVVSCILFITIAKISNSVDFLFFILALRSYKKQIIRLSILFKSIKKYQLIQLFLFYC